MMCVSSECGKLVEGIRLGLEVGDGAVIAAAVSLDKVVDV